MLSPPEDDRNSDDDTNREFKCFNCTNIYSAESHRYEHFRQVHCKKKFKLTCSQCRRKFSQCDDLLEHINACHKIIYNDDADLI